MLKQVHVMGKEQFTLIKIPIREIMNQNAEVILTKEEAIEKEYLITQGNSPLFDQIERLRGKYTDHINEIILMTAKKNPKLEDSLRKILKDGFFYNGIHYSRFGKSASQAKDGITAFVCDEFFDELYMVTQMDLKIDQCVISKYEAQRCLVFSSCTLIPEYIPKIVIIDEYQKTLFGQFIKYVVEREREYMDKDTGKVKKYISREIEEGEKDILLSPFDGCGCHEKEFMVKTSTSIGLDYHAIGSQIRMPFVKGYSIYVPFRQIFREWGITEITDVYGHVHRIDDIECIWNISMFKGHKIFKEKYGKKAWIEYNHTLKKYGFKLGISKYSHHIKNLNKKARMNFQYLQCLNLWNQKYIESYSNKDFKNYDILDPKNEGKMISIAKYTTSLFEKIIKGDKFSTYKFMGIMDGETHETESKYLEAVLINDAMLKDPAIRQFIYRKLKKAINEAKVGKIYAEGFYHTVIGDMIGYLQYAAGKEVIGCLKAKEFFCGTLDKGPCISFRSPLVCPSEVNKIDIAGNEITDKWFSHFADQDIVMLNMYDLSAPQQGGMDQDGDIVLLCNNPVVVKSKIDKPIIIDINDKATTKAKPYNSENIIEYEIMTRDNRIGEITNVATSIGNKYTANPETEKSYSDSISLLRIFQGKEIDFLKTGLRWHMNKILKNHINQLPYFLLFNYPKKMKTYESLKEKNSKTDKPEEKVKLNAYHSPSPMNELCDYICTWERKKIIWDNTVTDTRDLILNHKMDLKDRKTIRKVRHHLNEYASDRKKHLNMQQGKVDYQESTYNRLLLIDSYKEKLRKELGMDDELIANYVISVSYSSPSIGKGFAWGGYSEYILKNLKKNSNQKKNISITEVPGYSESAYEYLGKYYECKEADTYQ